jgi:hypothetical protein
MRFTTTQSAIQLAALFQCSLRKIPVGPISTLKDWNSKGRFVKRGEKAIWLCMPITGKTTDTRG